MDGVENGNHKERFLPNGPRQLIQRRISNNVTAALRAIAAEIFIATFFPSSESTSWQYTNNTLPDCKQQSVCCSHAFVKIQPLHTAALNWHADIAEGPSPNTVYLVERSFRRVGAPADTMG